MRLLVTGVLLGSGLALAQEPAGEAAPDAGVEAAARGAEAAVSGAEAAEAGLPSYDPELMAALQLPNLAHSLRAAGVPPEEVKGAIEAARQAGLGAADTADVLRRTMREVRVKGPIEGYAAFVKEQLEEGRRGRELADAIRRVHADRGKRVIKPKNTDIAGRPVLGADKGPAEVPTAPERAGPGVGNGAAEPAAGAPGPKGAAGTGPAEAAAGAPRGQGAGEAR